MIAVGLFIRLGRCHNGLGTWFKGIFHGTFQQMFHFPGGIRKNVCFKEHMHAIFCECVRERIGNIKN